MKNLWLILGICILTSTACNLTYRRPLERAADIESSDLFGISEIEALAALPTEVLVVCGTRFDWPVYVVAAGDTLSGIAVRSNSTVGELAAANCLDNPRVIVAGQRLHVPQMPVRPTPVFIDTAITDSVSDIP
jgi:hypothetical protein